MFTCPIVPLESAKAAGATLNDKNNSARNPNMTWNWHCICRQIASKYRINAFSTATDRVRVNLWHRSAEVHFPMISVRSTTIRKSHIQCIQVLEYMFRYVSPYREHYLFVPSKRKLIKWYFKANRKKNTCWSFCAASAVPKLRAQSLQPRDPRHLQWHGRTCGRVTSRSASAGRRTQKRACVAATLR